MSQAKLAAAREFIQEKNYKVARSILETLPDNPTATSWLAKLNAIEVSNPTQGVSAGYYPPPPPSAGYKATPRTIIYEYKTVKLTFTFNHDRAMNNKIDELAHQGWEFMDFKDEGFTNPFGVWVISSRLLRFRRPRR